MYEPANMADHEKIRSNLLMEAITEKPNSERRASNLLRKHSADN